MDDRYRTDSGPMVLGLLALVLLMMAGAGAWYAMQKAQTERERALALEQRRRAEAALAEAALRDEDARGEAALQFLAERLDETDPKGRPQPTVHDVLEEAELQVDDVDLPPEVREALRRAIEDARARLDREGR